MEPWRYACPSDGRPWGGALGITVEWGETGPVLRLSLCHRRPHPDLCSCSPDQKTDCNISGCCSSPLAWGISPAACRSSWSSGPVSLLPPLVLWINHRPSSFSASLFPEDSPRSWLRGWGWGAQRMVKKPGPSRTGGTPAPHAMRARGVQS